jgi:competence protein ComEC
MTKSNILLAVCLVFIGGAFLISPNLIEKNKSPLMNYNDSEKDFLFTGKVIKEPDERGDNIKLTVETEMGKALVTTGNYPEYFYGDVLKIKGKLKTPAIFEEFNYKNYLAKDGIYSVAYWPKIEILERDKGNIVYSTLFKFKNKMIESIEKIMPFPEASLLEGLVLGNRQIFSESLKESLNITGTSHIVAVSGMNIVIISELLMFLLIGCGLRRGQAFYFILTLIFLFIIMVGAPASAIRAGIMGGILLFAQKIGRLNNAGRAMIFAGAAMLAFNPLLLRYDVGFQLSFLAVFGLIYIKPILDGWLAKLIKKSELSGILQIITTTLAAQIAVLGILIYNFGRISFISPIVNVLVVPLLTGITAIILVFSGATFIWSFLGKILVWPAYFATTYILRLIEWFSKIPFAAKEISNMHWLWLVGYYVLLAGFLWWHEKRENQKNYVNI